MVRLEGNVLYSIIFTLVAVFCDAGPALDGNIIPPGESSLRWRRQVTCGGRFKCESGQCVDYDRVCNGFSDCGDNSDETRNICQSLRCPPRSFQCSYGACINDEGICNGKIDCVDGSDEKVRGCSTVNIGASNCLPQEFGCRSGQCVDKSFVCNGRKDCDDGSDEAVKNCDRNRYPDINETGTELCSLPEIPKNGDYVVKGCNGEDQSPLCQKVSGTPVTNAVMLIFSCNAGYKVEGNEQIICYSGKWFPTPPPHCIAVTQKYDYKTVLNYSLLFYEAQRSGKLPPDQKVTWRKDSALNDKGENGEDLTGGYYDAGDYMKYGFTMAHTAVVLAWGLISYRKGYEAVGALEDGRKAVKWATDYFLKAHVNNNTFYGQVGNPKLDHEYWGRPEDMKMERPAYKLDPENPGSDLIGETAAALAAGYIVFKDINLEYAEKLLVHAKQLFNLANEYRGIYSDSIPSAKESYGSLHYEDELVWAATWLHIATKEESYLKLAEKWYKEFNLENSEGFEWQQRYSGIDVLLFNVTNLPKYEDKVRSYCHNVFHVYDKTPKGLLFIAKWGPLSLSAKASFICMQAADMGIGGEENRNFARKQVGYMLGDTGRSFVVGFGNNPPTHVHHASSSCPAAPRRCDWSTYKRQEPNVHILYGALVGGPDKNDEFIDDRSDFLRNRVGIGYNAGFQSLIAALIQHEI